MYIKIIFIHWFYSYELPQQSMHIRNFFYTLADIVKVMMLRPTDKQNRIEKIKLY